VPSHDQWFDPFAKDWGSKVGVNVSVDHIDNAQIPTRIAAEIQAGQGHDLIQYLAPLSQFEPSVNDLKDVTDEATKRWGQQLELCKQSSFNPATGRYYAYSPGWVPDPGDYRVSLWQGVGMPRARPAGTSCSRVGPRSRSPRAPSSASACPRRLSYILNSISAWRTAQGANPDVANDVGFVPALRGPKDTRAAQHVLYNWIIPKHAKGVDAAKAFLLHYTENFAAATRASKLYDFPAYDERVPQLNGWLDKDPFGAKPADKLSFLKDATSWSTNIGYPGPSNTAIGEVFGTFLIPNMFASAARGEVSPKQAVARAEAQIKPIFEKWRARGLVGGT
jgi:ABC-type glycerol-3-phosphate transport system substrate-binding protein